MPSQEVTSRKRAMVQELNNFITQKKEHSSALDAKKELVAESSSRSQQKSANGRRSFAHVAYTHDHAGISCPTFAEIMLHHVL